ncbi:MAG: (2Fe-2S)-binding protein [bacterium]
MSKKHLVELTVNGEVRDVVVRARVTLLDALRDLIGLTGTKEACGMGTCGACTVLVDGRPVLSCLTLALECEGRQIGTVEGISDGERLSPLQQAFLERGATQCGFCTPGILLSASALLKANPRPTDREINKALEGNLCRCTGYNSILAAVKDAIGQPAPEGERR